MKYRQRKSIIVWLTSLKYKRNLQNFGDVYYVSQKMNYAVIYIYKDREEKVIEKLQHLNYVKKVEPSHSDEMYEKLLEIEKNDNKKQEKVDNE